MVHVQFGLGQSGDEGVQIAGAVACAELVGQGFLPGNGAPQDRGREGARVIG